jgi:hypothetical protein
MAIQAIGILRNLAATAELGSKLMSSGILGVMRGVLVTASGCKDIVFGLSRLFAKLTLCDDAVQEFLADREALVALVHAANAHAACPATALRFAFAFANLSEGSPDNAATVGAVRCCAVSLDGIIILYAFVSDCVPVKYIYRACMSCVAACSHGTCPCLSPTLVF